MPRFHVINKDLECQYKFKKNVLVVKRCRRIKDKKEIPTREILKSMGIKSY